MSDYRGKFLWYDLMTTDVSAAKAFYTEVVGWGTQEWEGSSEPYTMWKAGEVPIGGVGDLPEEAKKMGAPPHWLAYIGTPDVDATMEQVKKLGGTVLAGPMDIEKVGRFAVFADPQGAVTAAYTPTPMDEPWQEATGAGRITWHELMTSDLDAAVSFYSTVFGWQKTDAMDMGPAGTYQMFGASDGKTVGGMMNIPAEAGETPPMWVYYANVKDLEGSLAQTTKRGGKVMNGPMEVPGGDHVAQCMDPQGAVFAPHESKE